MYDSAVYILEQLSLQTTTLLVIVIKFNIIVFVMLQSKLLPKAQLTDTFKKFALPFLEFFIKNASSFILNVFLERKEHLIPSSLVKLSLSFLVLGFIEIWIIEPNIIANW